METIENGKRQMANGKLNWTHAKAQRRKENHLDRIYRINRILIYIKDGGKIWLRDPIKTIIKGK
jgi:hypothetical protein